MISASVLVDVVGVGRWRALATAETCARVRVCVCARACLCSRVARDQEPRPPRASAFKSLGLVFSKCILPSPRARSRAACQRFRRSAPQDVLNLSGRQFTSSRRRARTSTGTNTSPWPEMSHACQNPHALRPRT
eukprot:2472850-Rhodomonas_salina.4